MLKFLYFNDGDANGGDAAAIPVSLLRKVEATSGTNIDFEFKDVGDGIGASVQVNVAITDGTAKAVKRAISNAIRKSKSPFIVVADDLRGEYLHPDITGVGTINAS